MRPVSLSSSSATRATRATHATWTARATGTGAMMLAACTLTTPLGDLSSGTPAPADAGGHDAADGAAPANGDANADANADAGAGAIPRSCADVATKLDGTYTIDPDGAGPLPRITVFCNMTLAGGGWTLVARTAQPSNVAFGWNVQVGSVMDDTAPYSLGAKASGIVFTSLLIGVHGAGKDLVDAAYTIVVGSSFPQTYDAVVLPVTAATVLGTCAPAGGPSMLSHVGYTHDTTAYFLRDIGDERDPGGNTYGLFSDSFHTRYDTCEGGGNTNQKPGEIFVR